MGGDPVPLGVGESFHIGKLSFVLVRAPRAHTRSQLEGAEALTVLDPATPGPLVRDIALAGINVLILGETGVGKEVLAESVHHASQRKGPLVRINCAALSGTLLESELFGHEKGAFTGATESKPGLLETARDGTAFLDEVGELPLALQAKLLRVLETREVLRVGAVKPVAVDVRFVAATNRDLPGEVRQGEFRGDLYFRLDGVTLAIPPLRQRRHQVQALALRFLTEAHKRAHKTAAPRLAHDLMARLQAHDWPGNVRELKAVCERAVLLARGGEIGPRHLTLRAHAKPEVVAPPRPAPATPAAPEAPALDAAAAAERQRILDALEQCAGNQTRAAKLLGIARATLVNKLALYNIPRPRK
jgi:transcriptional regulator with PAS, ATPase and Fis domain